MTALEITNEVIDEAIDYDVDLIVVHHPLIFKSINNLVEDDTQSNKIIRLIKKDIAVYVMHTNVDVSYNGMNDWLCEIIGINDITCLENTHKINMYSIHIAVDIQNIDIILNVLPKFGIGKQLKDKEEQYLMLPKIKSYKDSKTNKIKTKDVTIIEAQGTKEQIDILKKYLYKLKIEKKIYAKLSYFLIEDYNIFYGMGRVGYIKPLSLEMLAENIKDKFKLDCVKLVGSREKLVKKVAIVGGSGSSYIKKAKEKRCDVLITGDVGFHDAQLALDLGICIIDPGHYIEVVFNDGMEEFLKLIEGIEVISSKINTNPFEAL